MISLGNQVTEQLNQLGIPPELIRNQLQWTPLSALTDLSAAYAQTAAHADRAHHAHARFSADPKDSRVGMAPAWSNPPPNEVLRSGARFIYRTYHRDRVPRHATAGDVSTLFGRRRRGAAMVRWLHRDPVLRQAFERSTALTVIRDGRTDGAVSVAAFSSSGSGGASSPTGGNNLYGFLGAMDAAIIEYAKALGVYSSSNPEVFFGDGDDLDLLGMGRQYGVPSPSTTGIFGLNRGGAGPAAVPPPTGDQAAGLDTKIVQLKRMMDKRSQMYDIVRTIFDKYNDAARTAIGNMKA